MDVVLDTENKSLDATSLLMYINHSPDTLSNINMHLYHNAFNEGTIAQQVWDEYGQSMKLEKGWTGITIESAVTGSTDLQFQIRDDTILDITLNHSLAPGDTLNFELKWNARIHPHLDRSGWEGQQFDFAQWYPKFVVYDENGWHDDPFGDWGEFYGEIGNFTVKIDLPIDQVVGATGEVVDGDPGWKAVAVDTSIVWEKWHKDFKVARAEYLAELDSSARRTVTFFAENVHDFAWICSPEFVYEHGVWNGVDIHVLFKTEVGSAWSRDVVRYGEQAVRWLSEKFGMYPWPQMTITQALLSGGMEYPMLIMDASDSESLTVHEIGHNWFYGLLGNDELDDAWLDEGFTSFQTTWYKQHHYPDNGYDLTRNNITQFESDHLPRQMYLEADLKPVVRYVLSPANQPLALHSFDYSDWASYRSNVYDKGSIMLQSLKAYLGEDRFLAGMRLYFDRWAQKHVNEARFIKAMEDGSGEELDWFFDQWLHTTHYVDYALTDWVVETIDANHFITRINVENKGDMFVPISATVYGSNGKTSSASLEEFRYRKTGTIEVTSDFYPQRVCLDAENVFVDVDRRNNDSQKKFALRYNYKGWDAYPGDRTLFLWNPQLGFSDKQGLGLGVKVDRVYRNTGNYTAFELDHNLESGLPDIGFSFKQQQVGLPFQGTWSGEARSWRSMTYAALRYELSWARKLWINPIHYLTMFIDYSDSRNADIDGESQSSFTRMGMQYDLQHDLWQGDYGLSVKYQFSPGGMGGYGLDFSQISFMSYWDRNFSYFNFNNRSNFAYNFGFTPNLVKTRIASSDLQSVYLNRMASTLHQTSGIDMLGTRYYLSGGARMRAYSDSLDTPINHIWSNNLDLIFKTGQYGIDILDFGAFIDLGQASHTGTDWMWLSDVGLSLTFKPYWERNAWISTILRPFQIKIEYPLARYVDGGFVSTAGDNLWVFTISK